MWMMGCSDVSDSFNGRKVRPLIPKPSSTTNNLSTPNLPYLNRVHGSDFLHHLGGEQNKRDFNVPPTALVSSRWNPTPEQLQTLEELYRRGTRTPSADQIQHITAQLRRYGKIEGKNVFYWFQNHKARERQKRRRRSESKEDQQQLHTQSLENKESGSSRTSFEVEQQAKNWGFSTNFSTVAEESVSMQRAEISERIQFEDAQVQQRRLVDRQPTWQMMQVSCSPSTTTPIFSTTITPPLLNPNPTFMSTHHLNIFLKPQRQHEDQENGSESHTLELFPLRKGQERGSSNVPQKEDDSSKETINNTNITTPHQFFEFL